MSRWASAAASRSARRLCAARTGAACEWRGSSTCDQPAVADVGQRGQHAGQVDLALAEGQVLVHAAAHVVDLHVDDEVAGGADDLGRAVVLAARRGDRRRRSAPAPPGGRAARRSPTTSPTRSRNIPGSGSSASVDAGGLARRAASRVSRLLDAGPALLGRGRGRQGPAPARDDARTRGRARSAARWRRGRSRRSRPSSLTKWGGACAGGPARSAPRSRRRRRGRAARSSAAACATRCASPGPSGSRWAWSRVSATPSKPRSASTASASPSRWSVKPLRP